MAKYLDDQKSTASTQPEPMTPVESRQGALGRPVLGVLVAGLVLAAGAWAVAEMWGETIDTDPTSTASTTRATADPAQGFDDNPADGSIAPAKQIDRDPTAQSSTGGQSQQISPDGTEK